MVNIPINIGELDTELQFSFSRSSGPGGQHVNKVNTRVELRFNVILSQILKEEQKEILQEKLANKLNQEGVLIIISQASRSQIDNKKDTIEKFYILINECLTPQKKRKPTRITKAVKAKRLKEKKEHAEKKDRRRFDAQ
ncbi:MAG: aminoacyl-tRNA hydrolase [Bacteroidales bacterium]|nr:aminoacyl-tRNA hydrolase [Bacteroidales bacterium]